MIVSSGICAFELVLGSGEGVIVGESCRIVVASLLQTVEVTGVVISVDQCN